MLKLHLLKTIKGFRKAADAMEKYVKQLEEAGLDMDNVKDPQLVLEIIMQIAHQTVAETLEEPLTDPDEIWKLYK